MEEDTLEELCDCGHPKKCHAPLSYCCAHTWPEWERRPRCACEQFRRKDPLAELRTNLRALLDLTVRLRLSLITVELREALGEVDTIALQRAVADTHKGRVYPWPDGALGTDAAAGTANASEQAHNPVSGDCGSEGTR